MSTGELPDWRSLLFCPANVPKFVEKANQRGADAVILDLEDSVAESGKDSARRALKGAIAAMRQGNGVDVCVRINRPLEQAVEDIACAVPNGAEVLVLPKVASAAHVQLLCEVILSSELRAGVAPGRTRLVALVETADAIHELAFIARAHERMVGLAVGGEDLATELHADPSADTLYVPKMLGVVAARAAGILPIGVLASVAQLDRMDEYRSMLERSRRLGFACATCVHPAQVPLLNQAFGPTPAEVERATRLVAAYEAAERAGSGTLTFEGKMVDRPVVQRAKRLLERAESLAARAAANS